MNACAPAGQRDIIGDALRVRPVELGPTGIIVAPSMASRPAMPRVPPLNPNSNSATLRAFVQWIRSAAPYIYSFRGKTFVIAFGGEVVADDTFLGVARERVGDARAA